MKPILCFLALIVMPSALVAGQVPRIAVASSLQFVVADIAAEFRRKTNSDLRITYGSSGNFRRQIEQGAPFELFLSADESYVDALVRVGLTPDRGRVYALGRIALIVPKQSEMKMTGDLSGLRTALADDSLTHFAIANPDLAPYGKAAREALEASQLWSSIQAVLVRGENASQATQFAISGSSQGGLIPYSLAVSKRVAGLSRVMVVNQNLHRPIRHRMVLLNNSGGVARQFYDFLASPDSAEIFRRYGYEIPPAK